MHQVPVPDPTKTTGLSWWTIISIAAPALAVLPLALVGFVHISALSDYSTFPLLIVLAAWMAVVRSQQLGPLVAGSLPAPWFMATLLLLQTAISIFAIQRMSLIWILFAMAAIGWRLGSWPVLRAWAPLLACMAWFIPPPLGLHDWAVRALQGWSMAAAHQILMIADILHSVRGHLIVLPEKILFVSEACSGTTMLLFFCALSCLFCVYCRTRALFLAMMLAATIGWVVVLNITRIVIIVLAFQAGIDLSEGWPHTLLGLGLIPIGAILIVGTGVLLNLIMVWAQQPMPHVAESSPTVWLPSQQVVWPVWIVVWCTGLLVFQLSVAGLVTFREIPAWRASSTHLPLLNTALPDSLAGWQRTSGPRLIETPEMLPLGVRSQQWIYAETGLAAQISVDDHFPGWHPLNDCYVFMGWNQKTFNEEMGALGPLMMALYESGPHRHGFLVFGLRSCKGEWIGKPGTVKRYSIAFINHLKGLYFGQGIGETEPPTRQLQVFIETRKPMNGDDQRRIVALFESARQILDPHLWPGENP